MATKTYRQYALDCAPPFLLEQDGDSYLRAMGDDRDAVVEFLKAGLKSRFPRFAAPDALTAIGDERGLPRSPTDTDADYAERLVGAWEVWQWAGTPAGVLNALWDAGYTNVRLLTQRRDYTLDGSRNLVIDTLSPARGFPPGPSFWNTFLVWFPQPWRASWGGGVPASGSAEAESVRRLVNRWKPGHAHVAGYIATDTGHFWGEPGLEWGAVGLDWGSTGNVHWTP